LMYAHNFDPEKSKNPFSYFTQIIYFAFLRRIEKEKKQSYIKYKIMEDNADERFHRWFKENYFAKDSSASFREIFNLTENDVNRFGDNKKKKKKKKKGAKPTNSKLWSRAKSLARSKFDVYPSAYANAWAAKWYKSKGGGWR